MVSKSSKSIILFVIAFGLVVGPLTYFLEENFNTAPSPKPKNITSKPTPPLRQVKLYEGVLEGEVVEKKGSLLIQAVSDFGDVGKLNETILSIDGVVDADINKLDNQGQNKLYRFVIEVEIDPEDSEKVGFFVAKALADDPFAMQTDAMGVPAVVSFPSEVTLSRVGSGANRTVELPENVSAYVFFHTHEGEIASFSVEAEYVGLSLDSVSAFEKSSRIYVPPTETRFEEGEAEVINVSSFSLEYTTDYGVDVNSSELESMLVEEGVNASLEFSPPFDHISVQVNNSTDFIREMNESGFRAEKAFIGVDVWINDSVNETLEAILEVAPNAFYKVPEGVLLLETEQYYFDEKPIKSFIPDYLGVPEETAKGCFHVMDYNETICSNLPVNVSKGDSVSLNITVRTIFGEIQPPIKAEVLA